MHLYEEDLKRHFITALSELLTDRTVLLEDGQLIRRELLDWGAIDRESTKLLQELDMVSSTWWTRTPPRHCPRPVTSSGTIPWRSDTKVSRPGIMPCSRKRSGDRFRPIPLAPV